VKFKKEFRSEKYYLIILFAIAVFFAVGIFIGLYIRGSYFGTERDDFDFSGVTEVSAVFIPGVDSNGRGVAAVLETNIREGSGFTLVNINDLTAGSSTQNSARAAVRAAKNYLNLSNETNTDVIYNIKTDAVFIDGPSAGAAMAVSLVSLLENKSLNDKVSITGYVDEQGIVGPASGIEQKASALEKEGIEILLVSDQVALPGDYTRQEFCKSVNGADSREYCEVNYVSEGEVLISGIKVIPVKDIEEALQYFYREDEEIN